MRNPSAAPDLHSLMTDLHETVETLKKQYHKDKLYVLGHSWGTVLGALYALEHPENVAAYIGVGQLVDVIENEQAGYNALKGAVIRSAESCRCHADPYLKPRSGSSCCWQYTSPSRNRMLDRYCIRILPAFLWTFFQPYKSQRPQTCWKSLFLNRLHGRGCQHTGGQGAQKQRNHQKHGDHPL